MSTPTPPPRFSPASPPPSNTKGRWLKGCLIVGCAGPVALLIAFFIVIGALMEMKVLPYGEVEAGSELTSKTVEFLTSEGLLEADESVAYFYSEGFLSIREGGCFFTEGRIVVYEEDWETDELFVFAREYKDIASIDVTFSESVIDDTWIELSDHDGETTWCLAGVTGKKDRRFVKELKSRWELYRVVPDEGRESAPESDEAP